MQSSCWTISMVLFVFCFAIQFVGFSDYYLSKQLSRGVTRIKRRISNWDVVVDQTTTRLMEKSPTQWVVLTFVNEGFYSFFENWYEHYCLLGIPSKVYVVAADRKVQLRLEARKIPNLIVETESTKTNESALVYGTKEYSNMMFSRTKHLLRHLEAGENVIFTDVDVIWKADPRPYFVGHFFSGNHAWFQREVIQAKRKGFAPGMIACAGFFAMLSCNATVQIVRKWEIHNKEAMEMGAKKGIFFKHDQDTFNEFLSSQHLKFEFLDSYLFPVGKVLYSMNPNERKKVVVAHFNWVIGKSLKEKKMEEYGMWGASCKK